MTALRSRTPAPGALLACLGAGLALLAGPSRDAVARHPLADGLPLERCAEPTDELVAGVSLSYLCQLSDRGPLGGPLDEFAPSSRRLRGGVLGPAYPFHNLHYARTSLGEARFGELRAIYEAGRVLSSSSFPSWNEPRILAACAASHPDAGERARCAADLDGLLRERIEAHAAELISTRRDGERFEYLDFGRPLPAAADWLGPLSIGYALNLTSFDPSTLPRHSPATGVEGKLILPLLVGPDGRAFTADDLPVPIHASPRLRREPPYPGSVWDASIGGEPVFDSIAVVPGTLDERGGLSTSNRPLVLFGVLSKGALERLGCAALAGRFDASGCVGAGGAIPRAELLRAGCHARTSEGTQGGVNAIGECVLLNMDRGSGVLTQGGVSRTLGAHADEIALLSDPDLRPASARLEPSDLTDFLGHALGRRALPTRPRLRLEAPPPPPPRPARRVDPATGAPVRRAGVPVCLYRTAGEGTSRFSSESVGPDGVRGNADDAIPSAGSCLLFDPPLAPGGPQPLRRDTDVIADHPAHQELFHRLCSAAFDDDDGHCGLDQFTHLRAGPNWERILNGSLLGSDAATLGGLESIRLRDQPQAAFSWQPGFAAALEPLIHLLRPDLGPLETLPLPPQAGALLGCGPAFARACGLRDELQLGRDASVSRLLGVASLDLVPRGLDLEFADASVLFQESPLEKALSTGALVGLRDDGSGFEAGIKTGGLAPDQVRALSESERAALVRGASPTDAWVEPLPWALDPDALARGIVLYQVADQTRRDPRCDPDREDRARDLSGAAVFSPAESAYCTSRQPGWGADPNVVVQNDPTDATNPANRLVSEGENCTDSIVGFVAQTARAGTLFAEGCTELEYLSGNLWRAVMGFEIVGRDRAFDPPETVSELLAILDGDPRNDLSGDPDAGADGIYVKNARVFSAERADLHTLLGSQENPAHPPVPELDTDGDGVRDLSMQDFFDRYVPSDCLLSVCRLRIGTARFEAGFEGARPQTRPILSALPVAMRMRLVSVDGVAPPPELSLPHVNVLEVYETDRRAFAELYDRRSAHLRRLRMRDAQGEVVELRGDLLVSYDPQFNVHPSFVGNIDLDPLGVQDLDQDGDSVYDGLDDGSPGPVADDGILCGPGVPGDFLQEAAQFEPRDRTEETALRAHFPEGLPPRSPVFCASLLRWHGFTARDANGSRRFRWHGADARLDRDLDLVIDAADNCPALANPEQSDRGGLGAGGPDGVGDACQCGDVSANGRVTATDALRLQQALLRIAPFQGGIGALAAPERCDADHDGACGSGDAERITRALLGLADPPGACPAGS